VSSENLRHPGRLLRTFAAEQIRIRTSALREFIHPLDAELAEPMEPGDAAQLDDFALRHIDLRFMRVDRRNDHPPTSGNTDPG
jgi:hypothetical protein